MTARPTRPITACSRCASTQMDVPKLSDGGVLGVSVPMDAVCRACGAAGTPLLFDSPHAYEEFQRAVQRGGPEE